MTVQFIDTDGIKTHAILPYEEYCKLVGDKFTAGAIPSEVVEMTALKGYSLLKAWRKHLKIKQADLAKKAGITQGALSQMEKCERPHRATLEKLSKAMGIDVLLLTDDDE